MKKMISFKEAYNIVMDTPVKLKTEEADLSSALNRILAADVKSDLDIPPFDKAAMDGYACRLKDIRHELTVIEEIPAGVTPKKKVEKDRCAKIMTGAFVPEGADCVIMKEKIEEVAPYKIRFNGKDTQRNICYRGEDIKKGEVVIKKGTFIRPEHIAILATTGCVHPAVYRRPRVGLIVTGTELVEPSQKVKGAKIRNSNSYQLAAQVKRIGAVPVNYGVARDTEEAIGSLVERAVPETDVLILCGGVSVGDYDLVPLVLRNSNIDIVFDRIAVKPGKPTTFARGKNIICFGLPGNPVSVFVIFEILVKPFLYKMMGHRYNPFLVSMPLKDTVKRKKSVRQSFIPVRITGGIVAPIEYHGSAHIHALCGADGIILYPVGVKEIRKGTLINVRLLS